MTQARAGREVEGELYRWHADVCKVFSHPTRLEILHILREQEMTVSELAGRLRITMGNLSQHLNMMKQRRVLASRKDGNNVYYRLAHAKILKAFDLIRETLLEQMERQSLLARHLERAQARR